MEGIFKIVAVGGDTVRNFTDRNGQPSVLHVRTVVLSNGLDNIAAELTGKTAETLDEEYYKAGTRVYASIRFRVQRGRDNETLFNSVSLDRMAIYD